MTELPEDEDARLRALFAPAAVAVPDAGFSERVAARIATASRRRRLVLGVASAVSVAVAAGPVWQLSRAIGIELATRGDVVGDYLGLLQSPLALAFGAAIVILPGLLRWLEE